MSKDVKSMGIFQSYKGLRAKEFGKHWHREMEESCINVWTSDCVGVCSQIVWDCMFVMYTE